MADIVTVTINGREVTGDRKTIANMLLNPNDVYVSSTDGPVDVTKMSKFHIKNALRSIYREWLDYVFDNANMNSLLTNLRKGPVGYGQFDVLMKELIRRNNNLTW